MIVQPDSIFMKLILTPVYTLLFFSTEEGKNMKELKGKQTRWKAIQFILKLYFNTHISETYLWLLWLLRTEIRRYTTYSVVLELCPVIKFQKCILKQIWLHLIWFIVNLCWVFFLSFFFVFTVLMPKIPMVIKY